MTTSALYAARPSRLVRAVRLVTPALAVAGGALLVYWVTMMSHQQRQRMLTTAVSYCTEASRLAAAATLDGLHDGMTSGDDSDGLVYKAALDGFHAQCQQAVEQQAAQRLDEMPEE